MEMLGIGADLVSILITFVILVGVLLGKKNRSNEFFPILLLMHALTLLADMGVLTFEGDVSRIVLLKICWILQFSFTLCGILGFNLYIDRLITYSGGKRSSFRFVPFLIVAALIILWILSTEWGFLFYVDEYAHGSYGKYFWAAELVACMIPIFGVARIIYKQAMKQIDSGSAVGVYIFVAIPLIILPFQQLISIQSFLFAAITVSYLTMYISIHVRQEQAHLEQEADNVKLLTELLVSQIQPHFIFNSLTTIRYLNDTNSQLATEAITKFTKYLRRNLDVISKEQELVRFRDELEHTKTYLWLEQLRFGTNLNVEYSIDCDDFMIPPLSVQPIVENAVKHGITKKIGGGKVTISVRETDKYYRITVSDDGVGFDKMQKNESKEAHIGINDIRKRLSQLNGSTLTVNSQLGVGTSAIYEIMKEE